MPSEPVVDIARYLVDAAFRAAECPRLKSLAREAWAKRFGPGVAPDFDADVRALELCDLAFIESPREAANWSRAFFDRHRDDSRLAAALSLHHRIAQWRAEAEAQLVHRISTDGVLRAYVDSLTASLATEELALMGAHAERYSLIRRGTGEDEWSLHFTGAQVMVRRPLMRGVFSEAGSWLTSDYDDSGAERSLDGDWRALVDAELRALIANSSR